MAAPSVGRNPRIIARSTFNVNAGEIDGAPRRGHSGVALYVKKYSESGPSVLGEM
jgi:hypothetical protein